MWQVKASPIPKDDYLAQRMGQHAFRDALTVPVKKAELSAAEVQFAIFSYLPSWVNGLMALRNKIVSVFGFEVGEERFKADKAASDVGDKVGFMTVEALTKDEIICSAEDQHMHFYLSVSLSDGHATVSTMVNLKTRTGRLYMSIIKPFHWVIARVVLHSAVKKERI